MRSDVFTWLVYMCWSRWGTTDPDPPWKILHVDKGFLWNTGMDPPRGAIGSLGSNRLSREIRTALFKIRWWLKRQHTTKFSKSAHASLSIAIHWCMHVLSERALADQAPRSRLIFPAWPCLTNNWSHPTRNVRRPIFSSTRFPFTPFCSH